MNKQEEILNRLEAARQIIRFNHPFEYCAYGTWRNPKLGVDALRYVANGFDVRMKQLPDKWADLKKAHANGAIIQFKDTNDTEWFTVEWPHWYHDAEYRIKPESIRGPLGPGDVPPGSVIRENAWWKGYVVPNVWDKRVSFSSAESLITKTYAELKALGYQINRSLSNGKWDPAAWEPCYKEVTKE